ncbi:hypothetical protein GCM10010404_18100 [Nonomuraea africana]
MVTSILHGVAPYLVWASAVVRTPVQSKSPRHHTDPAQAATNRWQASDGIPSVQIRGAPPTPTAALNTAGFSQTNTRGEVTWSGIVTSWCSVARNGVAASAAALSQSASGEPVARSPRTSTWLARSSTITPADSHSRTVVNEAHSSYWDRDSASLWNMGRIISAQTDRLVQPPALNENPQLLMPELDPELALRVSRSTP